MSKASAAILLAVSALIIGGLLGYQAGTPSERTVVTSQTIVERIHDQYFVVTKTAVLDQHSTITVDKGSDWSNFWWGQTIEAQGFVRVDVGVDVSGLSESDVIVDQATKTVTIRLPAATILDASQYGDIEAKTSKGVLKYLLDNDPNEDFNQAKAQLVTDARAAVLADAELLGQARADASAILHLILSPLGYSVVFTE